MTNLVSFSGYATAGKDAAADMLGIKLGFVKTYMSAPLEQALLTLDPWIPDSDGWVRYSEYHKGLGYDETKKNDEVRRLLQTLGTEVGRNMFGEDVWLDLIFKEIAELRKAGSSVTLTGVRYPNELERVRQAGGLALWIDRPGVGPVNTHSSDNTLGPESFDAVVYNNGTLEDLSNKLVKFFPKLEPIVVDANGCRFIKPTPLDGGMAYDFTCLTHDFHVIRDDRQAPEVCGGA